MLKFGFATIAATGFAAILVGLAAPAQAATEFTQAELTSVVVPVGIDHHQWVHDNQQKVTAPPIPIIGNGR
jgi:hypothetical protein